MDFQHTEPDQPHRQASSSASYLGRNGGALLLQLPPLSETDPLFAKKKDVLARRNLMLEFRVNASSTQEPSRLLNQMLRAARILHMNEAELYFIEEGNFGPFSERNELESLNSLLSVIKDSRSCAEANNNLEKIEEEIVMMLSSTGPNVFDELLSEEGDTTFEESLLQWGVDHGVKTKLKVSYFKGAGRGALALEDINVGETALEIPESLIISEEVVYQSEMFDILKNIDGVNMETMLLFWSMRERSLPDSKFKMYFQTLPQTFRTGLSFGIDALALLEGTLLFEEILQAREHLRQQYDALFPLLYYDYPEVFPPEIFTWEKFIWACELWYSNSMKVICGDGKLRTCLIPIAGFLNHSLCPHILHYGRVETASNTLKFKLSRPCKVREQCYLSYGSYPSSHLITFYGFMANGSNPYDVIPLDFDVPGNGNAELATEETGWTTHMVRETWLSKNHNKLPTFGLPPPLLSHLLATLRDNDMETSETSNDLKRAVLETIRSIFEPMMEGLGELDDSDSESSSWDVKLALKYKDSQRRIMSSVLCSCSEGLKMLVA